MYIYIYIYIYIHILGIILRTLNYGNHGIFLIMGDAGFISLTAVSSQGMISLIWGVQVHRNTIRTIRKSLNLFGFGY